VGPQAKERKHPQTVKFTILPKPNHNKHHDYTTTTTIA
jgi:hypothetical protein